MTVYGLDVSHYQGFPDWNAVSQSHGFGIAKVSEGTFAFDASRSHNLRGMKSAGMVTGGYHFAHTTASASAEAHFYLGAVAGLPADSHWLDLEANAGGLGSTQLDEWADEWCSIVQAAYPGDRVGLYTFGDFLINTMAGANRTLAAGKGRGLWYAAVGRSSTPGTVAGHQWNIWQYTWTGSVNGVAGSSLDHDVYPGSIAELRAWVHPGAAPVPAPTPVPVKKPTPAPLPPPVVEESDMLLAHPPKSGLVFLLHGRVKHVIHDHDVVAAYQKAGVKGPIELPVDELGHYSDADKLNDLQVQTFNNTTRLNHHFKVVK